jgi:electron transfer flavoprotein beta subunit
MKILVGIKHVPDTETKIKLTGDNRLDEAGVKWVVSPYDEFAVEQALLFREASEGEVIVASAGRDAAKTSLRQALAMGADRAVLVEDERFDQADALARARALAALAKEEGAEMVLVGKYGVGTDEWLTGPMVAELLGWAHAGAVSQLELGDGKFTGTRAVEGGVEKVEGSLPAVITCEKGLNEPRYASLKGIMQAKKKPIDVKAPGDVGVEDAELAEPRLVWEGMEMPPARAEGQMIDGSPEEAARRLVQLLREEAKVI